MKRTKFAVDTKVPVAQTRVEIETVLTKFGATSFAFAMQESRATIVFEFGGRRIRFDLPLRREGSEAATARLHREKWRALFLSIKAKLVSVDTGIETFEEAFLAHVVLADGSTVAQQTLPAIAQQYETGKMTPLLERAAPLTRPGPAAGAGHPRSIPEARGRPHRPTRHPHAGAGRRGELTSDKEHVNDGEDRAEGAAGARAAGATRRVEKDQGAVPLGAARQGGGRRAEHQRQAQGEEGPMIDRQGNRIVAECDSCDETRESAENETFTDFWNGARRDGWKAKRIGADWVHARPQCEV